MVLIQFDNFYQHQWKSWKGWKKNSRKSNEEKKQLRLNMILRLPASKESFKLEQFQKASISGNIFESEIAKDWCYMTKNG